MESIGAAETLLRRRGQNTLSVLQVQRGVHYRAGAGESNTHRLLQHSAPVKCRWS